MPTFISNDATINYATFGDASKPAVIFSNSLGTNYGMWQQQFNHFKNDYFCENPIFVCQLTFLHSIQRKI